MARRVIVRNMLDKALADTTAILPTHMMEDMSLKVNYIRSGTSTGTITIYGAMDAAGTVKYAIGVQPTLTGSRDADGAIAYTTSLVSLYEIPGIHPYIYIDWNEGTDGATISIDLYGVEDY